jgi:hypothetical protein
MRESSGQVSNQDRLSDMKETGADRGDWLVGGRRLVKKDPSVSQRSVQVVGSSWWPVEVEVDLPSLVVAAG